MTDEQGASLSSIELVYREQFQRFLHVAAAITGDVELAADSVQEAFANAIRHRQGFRGEGPLAGWLWQTVINSARRRTGRSQDLPLDPALKNGHEPSFNASEHVDLLRVLIAGLPERQRLVLFLRYYADLDYEGIAMALRISSGTVGATLNAAHGALRPLIQEVSP